MNILKRDNKIDREFSLSEIKSNHDYSWKDIEPFLNDYFEKAKKTPELISEFGKNIREMINHVNSRIQYWENRRFQFMQIAFSLLAASVVIMFKTTPNFNSHFLLIEKIQINIHVGLIASSCVMLISSIYALYLWNKQNNPDYPFTKAYMFWKWQYRYAEKTPLDVELSPSLETFKKQVEIFRNNMFDYKKKLLCSDNKELLDQELSQLYLLMINEKYKIKFVNQLRETIFNGLGFAGVVFIIAIISIFLGR